MSADLKTVLLALIAAAAFIGAAIVSVTPSKANGREPVAWNLS